MNEITIRTRQEGTKASDKKWNLQIFSTGSQEDDFSKALDSVLYAEGKHSPDKEPDMGAAIIAAAILYHADKSVSGCRDFKSALEDETYKEISDMYLQAQEIIRELGIARVTKTFNDNQIGKGNW